MKIINASLFFGIFYVKLHKFDFMFSIICVSFLVLFLRGRKSMKVSRWRIWEELGKRNEHNTPVDNNVFNVRIA